MFEKQLGSGREVSKKLNMGVKNEDGSICYIIGVRKESRLRIGKQPGDTVRVTVRERE